MTPYAGPPLRSPESVPFDLRTDPHEDLFDTKSTCGSATRSVWLRVRLDRAGATYGRSGATVGARTDQGTWVRVAWRRTAVSPTEHPEDRPSV